MYIHLIPNYFVRFYNVKADLIKYEIPELNISLTDEDLMTAKPYPNKWYKVACLKNRYRKAFVGFLLKTPDIIKKFTIIETWKIEITDDSNVKALLHPKNTIDVVITDTDYDFITQEPTMRYEIYNQPFKERQYNPQYRLSMPFSFEELAIFNDKKENPRKIIVNDTHIDIFTSIKQNAEYPTIEKDKYLYYANNKNRRLPALETAIEILL